MIRLCALASLVAGCLPKTYHCTSNGDCGASGTCEANGFCAYADSSCPDGVRYGDLSGAASHQCVGDESQIDAPMPASDATPDAAPRPVMFVTQVDPGYSTTATIAVPIAATAGDLVIAATYSGHVGTAVTVTDTSGATWTALTTREMAGCAPRLQLFYATVATTQTITVTVAQTGANYLGVHLVEYSGAVMPPVDAEAGQVAPAASAMATTGPIVTAEPTTIVALFADLTGTGTMMPGAGWTMRGADTSFYTLVVDNAPGAAPGTYMPAAMLPAPASDACWTAAAVALR
jgi:hypothetical protein